MARTRKAIQPLNLAKYDVLIEDRGVRSDYFKISQFDGYFYGGRNAFLVAGAGILRPNSNILVEVLNVNGTTVYSAPVRSFIEGSSRLIQVEVYEDTPIGPGKIVLLGSADYYLDGTPIPFEWQGKYNVRWMDDVIISPRIENKTPIRFVTPPEIIVEEKFYISPSSSFAEANSEPVDITLTPKYYNVFPNGYLLSLTGPDESTRFFNKYLNAIITGSIQFNGTNGSETASINIPITRIFNSHLAESEGKIIYTDLNNPFLGGYISASGEYNTNLLSFGNQGITSSLYLQYNELDTQITGSLISFAKIRLVNLSTISGEIHKIRVSYKPTTEPGEYVSLGDVPTFVAELFTIDSSSVPYETGYFNTNVVLDDYWYAATMSIGHEELNPIAPNYYYTSSLAGGITPLQQCCTELLDAVRVEIPISSSGTTFKDNVSYFIGNKETNNLTLFPQSEYTLSFEALVTKTSASYALDQSDYSMEIYLVAESGSNQRILDTNSLGQLIGTLTPTANFQKQNFETVEFNFTPKIKISGNFGIRFVVYGGFWNIANVSVKAAQEPFFSPDEFDILIPQVNYAKKLLEFKAEYLDVNNNSIGVNTVSLPTYFTGSEFFYDPFPYTGSAEITGSLSIIGTTILQGIFEKATIINAAPPSTTDYNILDQVVLYYTADTTNNWTLNVRGNATTTLNSLMEIGQSCTIVMITNNGAIPHYNTTVSVDGTLITTRWQSGLPPNSGNTNASDIYSYAIIKTGNAQFSAFAAQVIFG